MIDLKGMKKLTRNELVSLNGGGRNRCIRKFQKQIVKANSLNMTDDAREGVIGIILDQMLAC
ncbi:hypothetical protein [Aquimarina sp. MMG016]|uniref:hypothetical protein n=1 Tax=Aquimarina sp. MMG016 TaxID=2822690 RepID=UPI001B3A35FC|nr:hypothetical protein [Aquimarina sp. MMG016]MBQ4821642.1 hypothetical protein [Aquimarina sp. MMG016]